jgi:polysaccharide biosynthesis transport protein
VKQESYQPRVGNAKSQHAPQSAWDGLAPPAGNQAWQDYGDVHSTRAPEPGSLELLSDLIALIWLRIRLVALVTLAFASLGCLCAYRQQSAFESSAEVNLLQTDTASNTAEGSRSGSQNALSVAGEMRFLSSSRLIESFIESLPPSDLSEIFVTHHSLSKLLAYVLGSVQVMTSRIFHRIVPHHPPGTRRDEALEGAAGNREEKAGILDKKRVAGAFHKALSVKLPSGLGRENGVVEVRFRANRPEAAQKILRSYLEFYGQVVRDRLHADLEIQRSALKERHAKAEQTWLQSERTLAEFARTSGIVPGGDNIVAPALNLVNKSLERIVEAREEKERMRSLYNPDAESKTTALGKASDNGFSNALRQQLETLESQYADWETVYSTNVPKMIQMENRINHLRAKLDNVTKQATDAALESASREEMVREHTLDETRKDAGRLNALQFRYAVLKRKIETDNQVCQKFLNALGDLEIRSTTILAGVTMVEPPTLPSVPVALRRRLMIGIGIALGLLCGVAVAWATENIASNHKVLDIEKMATEINTRPLGIVPDFTTFDNATRKSKKTSAVQLYPADPSRNAVTHIIREIEAALFFLQSGEQPRITMVSSAVSQEGKTFFATSLACAMSSREGQKTLVIDADMRRPRLHEVFGHKDTGPGLSTVLTDRNTNLSRVIRRSQMPGLYYLTAGPIPADPLVLLRSHRFRQVLCTLARYFHNIVIDSPPVLSVPDYMPLCHLVKRVILVVKQGETLREEVRKSAGLIRSVPGTSILGVVLNRAEMSSGRYSSSACRHSRHHYRYRERYYRKVS